MMNKIRIGLLVMLIMGICVIPVTAVKIADINYLLRPNGEMYDSSSSQDFYGQKYDVLYISLNVDGYITLQVRGDGKVNLGEWTYATGAVNVSYVLQQPRSVHIYVENLDSTDTTVIGALFWNEVNFTFTTGATNVTNITTTTRSTGGIDRGFATAVLMSIYGLAGVLFIASIVVYRRRKNPDFSYLAKVKDEDLLPTDWNPSYDKET